MRRKTSGNTCARPISPTACSKTTPQSSTLASSHGVAFSTSSVASSPSPAGIGLLPVNHSEVWYQLLLAHRAGFFFREIPPQADVVAFRLPRPAAASGLKPLRQLPRLFV